MAIQSFADKVTEKFAGFHSIQINSQWRVVFKWTEAGAAQVEIIDYH